MDVLRSCYSTTMRFWTDDPKEIDVDWFFCSPYAEVFPHYTLFASGNWASSKIDWRGPGEVGGAPRPWRDGSRPVQLVGNHFCGPEKGFSEGTSWPGEPLGANAQGISPCCIHYCDEWAPYPQFIYWNVFTKTSTLDGATTPVEVSVRFLLRQTWPFIQYQQDENFPAGPGPTLSGFLECHHDGVWILNPAVTVTTRFRYPDAVAPPPTFVLRWAAYDAWRVTFGGSYPYDVEASMTFEPIF